METIMNSRKIYIITHKDNSQIPKAFNKNLYELLNVHKLYPFYNRLFSEYSGMYYIWKNKIYSDYVGFCHYHRYIYEYNLLKNLTDNDYQIFHKQNVSISIVDHYKLCNIPDFITNDIIEFLKLNNISTNIVYEAPNLFYNRMIYYCNWNAFDKLMIFLNGFISFVKNKYNINSEHDWKDHIINNIIMYYRDNYDRIINSKIITYNTQILFQSIDDFNNIFNNDYGLNSYCNCWRIYAYNLESLVSIFIRKHNPVYKDIIEEYSI